MKGRVRRAGAVSRRGVATRSIRDSHHNHHGRRAVAGSRKLIIGHGELASRRGDQAKGSGLDNEGSMKSGMGSLIKGAR